mmetsp:Transcript_117247/g.378369  ORF Transcript_117247/g.378369 Transcript_117247/m.378369 type:complete len:367 (+) Transcript_117247:116-1216(+)
MRLVAVIGAAAYELPLPPHWSEEVDSRGIVYFWHDKRAEATWSHPLLPIFQATLAATAQIANTSSTMEEVCNAIIAHLRKAENHAAQMLRGWTGPHLVYRPAGEGQSEFFFNERTGESTWDNPVEAPQYELFAQFNLFVRWLQHLHRSHENAAVGCDSRHQGWRTGGNDGETTRYPSFTKQKLRYPSFMVHELGIGASSIEGSPGILNNMLSSPVFPDELEDYVRWIRLSLTTTVPSANLESVLESKRPALPPLTGLNLNHLSTERQEGTPLQQQHPASAPTSSVAPAAQATRLRASVSARGSACHRRSSLPPLTALPLRRALLPLQKPPALERSPRQRSAPLLVTGPAAQLSGARPASQVFGSSS